MPHLPQASRRWCASLALCAALFVGASAQAAPVVRDVFFDGTGFLVFDASTQTGAWTGTVDESPFPVVLPPLSFLSVVSFVFDTANNKISGNFEFTSSDFSSTMFGSLSGDLLSGNFADGGQLGIEYLILGGTGDFNRASGFGLSLLDFDPVVGGFSAYREAGVMAFTVPEPATLPLLLAGLLGVAALRARSRSIN